MRLSIKVHVGKDDEEDPGRECEVELFLDDAEEDYSDFPDEDFDSLVNVLAHGALVTLKETLYSKTNRIIAAGG